MCQFPCWVLQLQTGVCVRSCLADCPAAWKDRSSGKSHRGGGRGGLGDGPEEGIGLCGRGQWDSSGLEQTVQRTSLREEAACVF